jgi:hypothetical protein
MILKLLIYKKLLILRLLNNNKENKSKVLQDAINKHTYSHRII